MTIERTVHAPGVREPGRLREAVARHLGIPEVIATRVASCGGVCLGRLVGPNCKGVNKLRLLREYLGRDHPTEPAYAYGDSRHDLPVLNWVSFGSLVDRHGLTRVNENWTRTHRDHNELSSS